MDSYNTNQMDKFVPKRNPLVTPSFTSIDRNALKKQETVYTTYFLDESWTSLASLLLLCPVLSDVNLQWHTLVGAIKVSDRFEVGTQIHIFFKLDHIGLGSHMCYWSHLMLVNQDKLTKNFSSSKENWTWSLIFLWTYCLFSKFTSKLLNCSALKSLIFWQFQKTEYFVIELLKMTLWIEKFFWV